MLDYDRDSSKLVQIVFVFFADGKRSNYFRLEFQGWNKGVACSNILWMMSESFSHDGVLDSCMIWRSKRNLERRGAYILVATRLPD